MPVLSLAFEDAGTLHDDLVLRLDHFDRRCDTYYLALDSSLLPMQEDSAKVRLVLKRLLEQWREDVLHLTNGGTTHLPYEFDDQASGWLQVSADSNGLLDVHPVWSSLEGWSFTPSAYAEARHRIGKTTPVWKTLEAQVMTRTDVLEQIEQSIRAAG